MKIVVTGGAGFIGSHLVDEYIKNGFEVLIIDNLSTGKEKNINKNALFEKVDLKERGKLSKIIEKFRPDIINHNAYISSISKAEKMRGKFIVENLQNFLNLIEPSEEFIKQFIFASSCAVYGQKLPPLNEKDDLKPINLYGLSKLLIENSLIYFSKKYNFKHTIFRYSNVYGPRQKSNSESGVISIFTNQVINKKPLTIFGDGENTRDFIFILDVIRANILSIDKEGIFNIGTGKETSINELVKIFENITGLNLKKNYLNKDSGIKRSYLDIRLAKEFLNFKSETDLYEGLKKILEYYEKN